MDDELLERIVEVMVSGGYDRSRISSLSPFDKLTRGIAWCIAASNVHVNYEYLDYDEDATLGERIQIGESIELALQKMDCPHRLQAHQIQGLDYPAVLPVVQWLVKRIHEQVGDKGRRHFRFGKRRAQRPSEEDEAADRQVKLLSDQIELHEARLRKLKEQSKFNEQHNKIEQEIEKRKHLQLEISRLLESAGISEDSSLLHELVDTVRRVKKDKGALQREEMQQPSRDASSATHLRTELARTSRAVILLQRKLDDVPTQSELMQYERCFMELYVNIQAKLRETRKYFASYNALAEATELSTKEVSLLNSIHSQLEIAMSTPGGRDKFLESMQGLYSGVQQKLAKMNARVEEKKAIYSSLKAKLAAASAAKRQYYSLVKQLQNEYARHGVAESASSSSNVDSPDS